MVETRLPASIDAIVAALQPVLAPTPVYDGPILTGDYSNAVYIGYDADPSGAEDHAGSTQQTWAGLGQRKRDEEIQIICAVVTLTGNADTSWKASRDSAFALLEKVGQTLRADPSLALSPPSVAELMPGDLFQENGPEGLQARIVFAIHHKTRV
jgi:hypothetical protein